MPDAWRAGIGTTDDLDRLARILEVVREEIFALLSHRSVLHDEVAGPWLMTLPTVSRGVCPDVGRSKRMGAGVAAESCGKLWFLPICALLRRLKAPGIAGRRDSFLEFYSELRNICVAD